jgi:hypothetical protein
MRKGIRMEASVEPQTDSELIPLKTAAYDLGLTPEGLRQRLIRLQKGVRCGGRWFIEAQLVDRMRQAAEVLGGAPGHDAYAKKEPRPSCDSLADQAGQLVEAASTSDSGGFIATPVIGRNKSKANKLGLDLAARNAP